MNELEIFNYGDTQIRTVQIDSQPCFVLKDVCEVFGETNYRRVTGRLDDDEKGVSQIDTPGGIQKMTVVNEPGLYSVLFTMQPEKARGVSEDYIAQRQAQLKAFKRWITHEVIPSIRKTGSYSVKRTENSENVYLKAAQILSRCTAANRPYVLAMLEAGGIKVDVAEERPKAKELPAAPKKERRGETIYGMSHERDVLFALWNCELPLKELAGVTGIPLETLRSYYYAKTIPTERHIGLLKETLKSLINNKVGA